MSNLSTLPMQPIRKFDKKVRFNFKIACHGYGQNVKEALIDAANRLGLQAEHDFGLSDFKAIERFETISIDQDDFED